VGTNIEFVMTGDGEVVRMHVGGKPNNETTMLLNTSVSLVSRSSKSNCYLRCEPESGYRQADAKVCFGGQVWVVMIAHAQAI